MMSSLSGLLLALGTITDARLGKLGGDLAFLKKYPYTAVLIRQVRTPANGTAGLKSTVHRHLVQLHRVYIEKSLISMVYEITVASLSDILSFRPHWGQAETAAVCYGILSALKYLHNTLHISHGDLRVESIRIDWYGTIKLANIGESLLRAERGYGEDIRSLPSIVKLLIGTSDLKVPLNDDLSDFLKKLEGGKPASEMLGDTLMAQSSFVIAFRRGSQLEELVPNRKSTYIRICCNILNVDHGYR